MRQKTDRSGHNPPGWGQIDRKIDGVNGRAGKRLVLREAMKQSKGRSTGHRQRQSPKLVADMTTQRGRGMSVTARRQRSRKIDPHLFLHLPEDKTESRSFGDK